MSGGANQTGANDRGLRRPSLWVPRGRCMAMTRQASDAPHAQPWIGWTLHDAPVHAASPSAKVAKPAAHQAAGMTIHEATMELAAETTRAMVHKVTMQAESGAATIEPGTTSGVIDPK
jgi:hypothetical protein